MKFTELIALMHDECLHMIKDHIHNDKPLEFDIEIPGANDATFVVEYSRYIKEENKQYILNILMSIIVQDKTYIYNFEADSLSVSDNKSYIRHTNISNKTYIEDVINFKQYIQCVLDYMVKNEVKEDISDSVGMIIETKNEDDLIIINNLFNLIETLINCNKLKDNDQISIGDSNCIIAYDGLNIGIDVYTLTDDRTIRRCTINSVNPYKLIISILPLVKGTGKEYSYYHRLDDNDNNSQLDKKFIECITYLYNKLQKQKIIDRMTERSKSSCDEYIKKDFDMPAGNNITFEDLMKDCNALLTLPSYIYEGKIFNSCYINKDDNSVIIMKLNNDRRIGFYYGKDGSISYINIIFSNGDSPLFILFKQKMIINNYICFDFELSDNITEKLDTYINLGFYNDIPMIYNIIHPLIPTDNISINIFISQPMRGLDINDIKKKRNELVDAFEKYIKYKDPKHNYEINVLNNLQEDAPKDYVALDYLSNDIRIIKDADVIIFADGWNEARGCLVEELVWYNYKRNSKCLSDDHRWINYKLIEKNLGLNKFTEEMIYHTLKEEEDSYTK